MRSSRARLGSASFRDSVWCTRAGLPDMLLLRTYMWLNRYALSERFLALDGGAQQRGETSAIEVQTSVQNSIGLLHFLLQANRRQRERTCIHGGAASGGGTSARLAFTATEIARWWYMILFILLFVVDNPEDSDTAPQAYQIQQFKFSVGFCVHNRAVSRRYLGIHT